MTVITDSDALADFCDRQQGASFVAVDTEFLSERQIRYALADVVHLRTVYEKLQQELASNGRASWFAEEMAELSNPEAYRSDPHEAWRRFRLRGRVDARFFGVLREVAAWRETAARQRDLPRGRIMRDEAVLEI